MPQSVTIDLPLIVSPKGELTLVRPLGFSDISQASASRGSAIAALRRQIVKRCRSLVASELVRSLVRGVATTETIDVTIAPESWSVAWGEPIRLSFEVFVWQQGEEMKIAYVPPLDLTVIASLQTNLEKLVQEQIRSAIRRRGIWSLVGLAGLAPTEEMTLSHHRLEVELPTPAEYARKQQEQPQSKTPTLSSVASRLNGKTLRRAFFRDAEVEQLARLLAADPARSVLLVGPSGVGKSAIFHQWVRSRGSFPSDAHLASATCWATDGSRLISGQCGFGMWQRQCLDVVEEARRYRCVIHLGNLVELCESGKLRGSGGCGALLAPHIANGSLKAVIECTPEQLTRVGRVEPRLVEALTTLRVEEPTAEQTRSILLEAATSWRPLDVTEELKRKKRRKRKAKMDTPAKRAPSVVVQPEALQVVDRLHRRFRTDAAAPGRPLAFFHAVMSELGEEQTLDVPAVIEAFGRQTGLPSFLIDDAVRPDLESIQQQLSSQVIGQDDVIETLVDLIATLAADLSRGDRPLASLMFLGPTGVGKTETAKALARLIYSDVTRLVRIDMSELSTSNAAGRLIGDAMHPEGLLTSAVRAQPFSLVLLDEFEKAHPSVFDLLLQVLGEGRLTDGRGRLADFRNSIVLMTSNLGVDTFHAVPLGLADTQASDRYHSHFERQVREFLRPEMFNRIDRILTFHPLDQETVEQIARLRIDELQQRDGWQSYGERCEVEESALASLAELGYQPQYGARPLARAIERKVTVPLAESICSSGRCNKLEAKILRPGRAESDNDTSGGDPTADSPTIAKGRYVQVRVKPAPAGRRQDRQGVVSLVEGMTTLRRRSQAFDRCDAVRQLRNQYTMVNRKLKTLLRAAKDQQERDKLRYGSLGAERMQTRERILMARKLCEDIAQAESRLLTDYYAGATLDPVSVSAELETLQERLWSLICELLSGWDSSHERITLILTCPDFRPAKRLLEAYQRLARARKWNLQIHALLCRNRMSMDDPALDCFGWSERASFQVATDHDRLEAMFEPPHAAELRRASLAAYQLLQADSLSSTPPGTLGLMMTFRGKHAGLMMGGEAGVHTFKRLNQAQSSGFSVLIDSHPKTSIEYIAPEWLPRRDFQLTGNPRRAYDIDATLVHDLTEVDSRTIKMDREGRWLEKLIEEETERRVWAALEDDALPQFAESTVEVPY